MIPLEQVEVPDMADVKWDTVTDIFSKAREGHSELAPLTVTKDSRHNLQRETVSNAQDDLILKARKSGGNLEEELDQIYSKILSYSMSGDNNEGGKEIPFRNFKEIVGACLILFNNLSTEALSQLLSIPSPSVIRTLLNLRSIIDVPENQKHAIRLLHPSFRDFFLTKERCQDPKFWVDEKVVHGALADSCLRLMSSKLKRDICGLRAPGALCSYVQGDQIEQCLPAEVQYACRYWMQHLERSDASLFDNRQVDMFLRQQLLCWLEALSLLGRTSEGILAITSLESLLMVSNSLRT